MKIKSFLFISEKNNSLIDLVFQNLPQRETFGLTRNIKKYPL